MKSAIHRTIVSFFFFTILCTSIKSIAVSPGDSLSKKELTIAFIFPFNTSKVFISDLEQSKYFFPEETQIASEFLQGAMQAVDSLKQQGLNARVLVYDSGSDSSTIENVLRKPDLQEADIIFGPFNGYALKAVSEFGEHQRIPVISTLAVSFSGADSNQYLILANASMKTHCERIYNYMLTQALTHRTLMVYRKRPEDLEIVKYFKQYAAQKKSEGSPTLKFVELTDSTKTTFWKIRDSLFTIDENQILIASTDEPFVRTMIKQLSNLQDKYKMNVYGMPTWDNFELIPGEQLDTLNAVITSSIWLNKSSAAVDSFKNQYKKKYEVNPSEYSVRGYDETFYFISELMKNSNLPEQLLKEGNISMLATSFHFSLEEDETQKHFLENHELFLLGRSDGRWILKN